MPDFRALIYHCWLAATGGDTQVWYDALGNPRSPKWPAVRRRHLAQFPTCCVCGTTKAREVHHIEAFHANPARELDPLNLMTLCRPHHWLFGHFCDGTWRAFNKWVRSDTALWAHKIRTKYMDSGKGAW